MHPDVRWSAAARAARAAGQPVRIEHEAPRRALAFHVAEMVDRGATRAEIEALMRQHYRVAIVTREEQAAIDRRNRTKLAHDRLEGIDFAEDLAQAA